MLGLLRLLRLKPCCKKSACRHTSGGAMACLAGLMAAEPPWETCCISLRSPWTRYLTCRVPSPLLLLVVAARCLLPVWPVLAAAVGPVVVASPCCYLCQSLLLPVWPNCCWNLLAVRRVIQLLLAGLGLRVNPFGQVLVPVVIAASCCCRWVRVLQPAGLSHRHSLASCHDVLT